ncbi:hypothetical protein QUB28_07670 [Microcoleus sp. B4-C3]
MATHLTYDKIVCTAYTWNMLYVGVAVQDTRIPQKRFLQNRDDRAYSRKTK